MEDPFKHWKSNGFNTFLQGEGFHISYCPNTNLADGGVFNEIGKHLSPLLQIKLETDGRPETAIVFRTIPHGEEKYYILNGDYRREYEELLPKGLTACIEFFNSKPDLHSGWSN